jgi:hypothetical protein
MDDSEDEFIDDMGEDESVNALDLATDVTTISGYSYIVSRPDYGDDKAGGTTIRRVRWSGKDGVILDVYLTFGDMLFATVGMANSLADDISMIHRLKTFSLVAKKKNRDAYLKFLDRALADLQTSKEKLAEIPLWDYEDEGAEADSQSAVELDAS